MKIFYGAASKDVKTIKKELFKEGIPLIGYIPNKNPKANGKFIIQYPDGHNEYVMEDKSKYKALFFSNNGHLDAMQDLREKARKFLPIILGD